MFEFLLHSMLAVSASHLSLSGSGDYTRQALAHRVISIRALNAALSNPASSAAEADARFATAFILLYQSSYMPDGMYDFLSMLRGCYLVADLGGNGRSPTSREPGLQAHRAAARSLNSGIESNSRALLDKTIVEGFLNSMKRLSPLCTSPDEAKYYSAIRNIMAPTTVTAVDAVKELGVLYIILGSASASELRMFTDPLNHVGQLLLAHFFLIECVVQTSVFVPINGSRRPHRKDVMAAWVRAIAKMLPEEYQEYVRWPMEVFEMQIVDEAWLLPWETREQNRPVLIHGTMGRAGLRQQWQFMSRKAERRGLMKYAGSEAVTVSVNCVDSTHSLDDGIF
ncbi:hypothetical protein VPNG_08091 [Cytospora leucostoma]|uniref:Transcription factor domain-containing protein n=1 Tax=Cytospora leucostoma TaxID=1230097 RepID=A0A423WSS5_9PEZI|nr:hypothetical protein VPNG_08091 [Cytospora leucostoma]